MGGYQAAGLLLALYFVADVGAQPAAAPMQPQPEDASPVGGKTLFGTVYAEETREPIALAKVYDRQGQVVQTDERGRFEFQGVASDAQRIMVTSTRRATRLINVDLPERTSAEVDIFLSLGAIVRGRVCQ